MNYSEAIEHTKNKKGTKQSFNGFLKKVSHEIKRKDPEEEMIPFVLDEMSEHYQQAREAWLTGDLETVAEFFGLYV